MSSRCRQIIFGAAIFVVVLGLAGATPVAWAQKPLPRGPNGEQIVSTLGGVTTRFYRQPVNTVAALKKMASEMRGDIGLVLDDAELGELTDRVVEVLTSGAVTETTVPVGTQMQWMALRRKGKVDLIRNLSWGGKAAFPAYRFTLKTERAEYEFVVPKLCANLSLVKTTPIAAPPPVVAPVVTPPPAAAPPPVVEAPPPPVAAPPVVEAPVVIPPPAIPVQASVSRLNPFVMAAFGKQRRTLSFDENAGVGGGLGAFCDPLFGIKGGLQFQVADHFMIAPAIGMAFNLDEGDRSGLFADLELNYTFNNGGYVGSGFGVWDLNHGENRTGNLMFQFGVPIAPKAGPANWLFAFESRLFFDEMDNVKNNYQMWAGVRYVFR